MSKIHVLGASGSGTTTTAKALAKALNYSHLDTDDYFWEKTDVPFTKKRKIEDRVKLLEDDILCKNNIVLSGIFYPWGDMLTKYFDYLVYVETDDGTRIKRLIKREYDMYGSRMLKGGDMHIQFKRFLTWAMNYEKNTNEDIGREKTETWMKKSKLRVIRVDGTKSVDEITKKIINELENYRKWR